MSTYASVWATGSFTPTAAGAELSAAALFDGAPVPVTLRFSDGEPGDQGVALRFHVGGPEQDVDLGFTDVTYHGVHTIGLVDETGRTTWARLSLVPADRLSREPGEPLPARFLLTASFPEEGAVTLGSVEVQTVPEAAPELSFDPLGLPFGFETPRGDGGGAM
ncbi:hypothetical protein CTZ27_12390 [Streptomyces griseocarneus]|nr:hypothetical protein CTZ27_12390 [Streptomyces griseocarneus]